MYRWYISHIKRDPPVMGSDANSRDRAFISQICTSRCKVRGLVRASVRRALRSLIVPAPEEGVVAIPLGMVTGLPDSGDISGSPKEVAGRMAVWLRSMVVPCAGLVCMFEGRLKRGAGGGSPIFVNGEQVHKPCHRTDPDGSGEHRTGTAYGRDQRSATETIVSGSGEHDGDAGHEGSCRTGGCFLAMGFATTGGDAADNSDGRKRKPRCALILLQHHGGGV